MRKWWIVWPLYAALMGFAVGASFFFGLYGRNVTESSIAAQHEQQTTTESAKSKKEESDEALAYYTLWLMGFTGVLAFATLGLGIATVLLYFTGEKQLKAVMRAGLRQSRDTKESIRLARDEFLSTHRPKIRIKHVWLSALGSNQPVTVDIVYVNVGDAKAVISSIGVDFNVINTDARLPPDMTAPGRAYIRHPECGMGATIRTGVISLGPLSEERVDAIRAGAKLLCCFGFVEYSDNGPLETRKIRRSTFCRVYKPSARAIDGMGRFVRPAEPDPDYEYED